MRAARRARDSRADTIHMSAPIPPASEGQIRSAVCHLDGERGRLTYRGYDVVALAEEACFEQVAYLLVTGQWPSAAALRAFRRAWVGAQRLSADQRRKLARLPAGTDELVALRTAVSALGLEPSPPTAEALPGLPGDVLRLLALVPAFAAERLRRRRGGEKGPAWGRQGLAAGFLRVATGREPPEAVVRAFDAALTLRADNELNPGTFAVRVAASTGADLVSAVVAGLAALQGPKHSGHTIAVSKLLDDVGEPARAPGVLAERVAAGKKPAGFGHPVYRVEDPRTAVARRLAEAACAATGHGALFALARAVEEAAVAATGQHANVDYYLTVVYRAAGLPVAGFAPVFAVARTSGWLAHALEQGRDPELIRPRATYVGPVEQALPRRRAR